MTNAWRTACKLDHMILMSAQVLILLSECQDLNEYSLSISRGVPIIGLANILATNMNFFTNISIGTKQ